MSQVATYRDKKQVVPKAYAPGGCPIPIGKVKCGETKGLDIIMDFHKLYQDKMSEIDISAGGDSLQEKVDLQQEWINDLTEQNKLLAKVIEELETEAIGRVQQLEDKLKNAAKSLGEEDEKTKADKDKKIKELEESLQLLPITSENMKKKAEENDRLKKDLEEMRVALTEEVARKHDTISLLRHEVYQLEVKNIDTQKEVSIKDDIIRELRKELKKTKLKMTSNETKNVTANLKTQAPETSDKGINTTEEELLTINHSTSPQPSNNSTVIFIHRGHTDENNDHRAIFDSSDSSECGLNENVNITNRGLVHTCRSENDIKQINWIKPTKERSKLTRVHKNDGGDQASREEGHGGSYNPKKLSIPKHISVKTHVNNIEYIKDIE